MPAMVVLPLPPLPASATEYGIFVSTLSFEFRSRIHPLEFFNPVIWKEQVVLVVGAASSRDHLISRLEAAPTWVFLWLLGLSG
jgi:hypothetical protein